MPDIKIKALDGKLIEAYLAEPKSGHGPGLLVAHEVFGLNDTQRAFCEKCAERGFLTLCPNLYSHQEPLASLSEEKEEDLEHALRLYKGFDVEAGVRDLLAALAFLRSRPDCAGKVGIVGSCLGSRMAYLMAARSDVDCAIGNYCVGFDSMLDEAHDIRQPALFNLAGNDKFCPPSIRDKVLKTFSKNKAIHVELYSDVDHGFLRPNSPKFNAEAADRANQTTLAFLTENLMSKL